MRALVAASLLFWSGCSACQGFSFTQETSMVFKLNNPAVQLSSENTRYAFSRTGTSGSVSSGGSGLTVNGTYYDKYQYAQPMNNVIQVTENYEIILNGDNNNVSAVGAVLNVDQVSEGAVQDTGNSLSGTPDE